MNPQLALYLGWAGVFWLIREDMKWRRIGSKLLLVPIAWLAIQGSRPVSYWFEADGGGESNPINTFVFAALIGAATCILASRRFKWGEFFSLNKALFLVYLYLLLTAVWSDAPFTSIKRLLKDFGCVLMPLVLLTQTNPIAAIRGSFVRVSYILFPMSVVFIKFFPDIGRSFTKAGEPMFGGVTVQKNSLGEILFVFGLMLLWDLVEIWKERNRTGKRRQIYIRFAMLLIGAWLLIKCDSQTSLVCLVLGAAIFWTSKWLVGLRNGKRLLIGGLVGISCLVAMDKTLGISDALIRAVGRDPSLTGRTDIWRIVLEQKTDPIFGFGFYSFWDSNKGKAVVDEFMQINSAHNGYLEMYVDGGLVGLAFLGIFLLSAGRRVINRLFSGHPLGEVGLVFWLLSIVYNVSETSFFKMDPLWLVLIMVSIECPRNWASKVEPGKLRKASAVDRECFVPA